MISKKEYLDKKRNLTAEQVLDDELILCEIGTLESFESPFDALQAILDFHIELDRYYRKSD